MGCVIHKPVYNSDFPKYNKNEGNKYNFTNKKENEGNDNSDYNNNSRSFSSSENQCINKNDSNEENYLEISQNNKKTGLKDNDKDEDNFKNSPTLNVFNNVKKKISKIKDKKSKFKEENSFVLSLKRKIRVAKAFFFHGINSDPDQYTKNVISRKITGDEKALISIWIDDTIQLGLFQHLSCLVYNHNFLSNAINNTNNEVLGCIGAASKQLINIVHCYKINVPPLLLNNFFKVTDESLKSCDKNNTNTSYADDCGGTIDVKNNNDFSVSPNFFSHNKQNDSNNNAKIPNEVLTDSNKATLSLTPINLTNSPDKIIQFLESDKNKRHLLPTAFSPLSRDKNITSTQIETFNNSEGRDIRDNISSSKKKEFLNSYSDTFTESEFSYPLNIDDFFNVKCTYGPDLSNVINLELVFFALNQYCSNNFLAPCSPEAKSPSLFSIIGSVELYHNENNDKRNTVFKRGSLLSESSVATHEIRFDNSASLNSDELVAVNLARSPPVRPSKNLPSLSIICLDNNVNKDSKNIINKINDNNNNDKSNFSKDSPTRKHSTKSEGSPKTRLGLKFNQFHLEQYPSGVTADSSINNFCKKKSNEQHFTFPIFTKEINPSSSLRPTNASVDTISMQNNLSESLVFSPKNIQSDLRKFADLSECEVGCNGSINDLSLVINGHNSILEENCRSNVKQLVNLEDNKNNNSLEVSLESESESASSYKVSNIKNEKKLEDYPDNNYNGDYQYEDKNYEGENEYNSSRMELTEETLHLQNEQIAFLVRNEKNSEEEFTRAIISGPPSLFQLFFGQYPYSRSRIRPWLKKFK